MLPVIGLTVMLYGALQIIALISQIIALISAVDGQVTPYAHLGSQTMASPTRFLSKVVTKSRPQCGEKRSTVIL